MNKRDRVYATLEKQPVDRVPLALWRYFHKQSQTPTGLVSATLAFYRAYDFDLIILTPSDLYAIEDWGGNITRAKDDDTPPRLKRPVIKSPEDWRHLTTLNPNEGSYGETLEAIRLLAEQLDKDDAPVLMPIFSPLTIAYQLAGETLLEHLQTHPTDVHIGLATIAEMTSRFADEILEAGADGIFFTSHMSQASLLTEEACQTYVIPYDLIALERVKSQPAPLILHLHGEDLFFESANQYPAHAISWDTSKTSPSIAEALQLTDKTLLTGLDAKMLAQGTPSDARTQAQIALEQTGKQRLILGPGCAVEPKTPTENLQAIIDSDRSIE